MAFDLFWLDCGWFCFSNGVLLTLIDFDWILIDLCLKCVLLILIDFCWSLVDFVCFPMSFLWILLNCGCVLVDVVCCPMVFYCSWLIFVGRWLIFFVFQWCFIDFGSLFVGVSLTLLAFQWCFNKVGWFWLSVGWFCLFSSCALWSMIDVGWAFFVGLSITFCGFWLSLVGSLMILFVFQLCVPILIEFGWMLVDSVRFQLCFIDLDGCWCDVAWFYVLFNCVLLISIGVGWTLVDCVRFFQCCYIGFDGFWLDSGRFVFLLSMMLYWCWFDFVGFCC